MKAIKSAVRLVKAAARASSEDKVPMMGAALAYYTAFSIAPILVIAIGVVGIVFGERGGTGVFDTIRGLIGDNGALAIQSMVDGAASKPHAGVVATAVGIVTLLVGASGVFGQLQEALNVIWKVTLKPTAGWGVTLRRRLLSFGMVGVIAFLLLVSLVVSAGLSAAGKLFMGALPGGEAVWQAVNAIVSFGVISALFALIFKVLPDVKLPWRVAWTGGLWTSLLFSAGKLVIGLYLGKSGVASTYGAAGSVIVLLLWVYYSSQILLFGAELTRAQVERSGLRVVPKDSATRTLTAFNAAAMAEKAIKDGDTGAAWYVLGSAALMGGIRLVKQGQQERFRSPWRQGVLGGFSAGLGLALLALLEARKRAEPAEEEDELSFARRVIASIPFKRKIPVDMK
jgi:membrane protein